MKRKFIEKINSLTNSGASYITVRQYSENVRNYNEIVKKQLDYMLSNLDIPPCYDEINIRSVRIEEKYTSIVLDLKRENSSTHKMLPLFGDENGYYADNNEIKSNQRKLADLFIFCETNINFFNKKHQKYILGDDSSLQISHVTDDFGYVKEVNFCYNDFNLKDMPLYLNSELSKDEIVFKLRSANSCYPASKSLSEECADTIYIDTEKLPDFIQDFIFEKYKHNSRKVKKKRYN